MKIKISTFILLLGLVTFLNAQDKVDIAELEKEIAAEEASQTQQALNNLPGASQIPLEKYDTTAVVEIPVMNPSQDEKAGNFDPILNQQAPEGSQDFNTSQGILPDVQDPQAAALQTPEKNALAPNAKPEEVKQQFGFKLNGEEKSTEKKDEGALAVYINMEEVFNNNPWTIEARKTMRLELEAKQLEYSQLQDQVKSLKEKLNNLRTELKNAQPFYEELEYIPPTEDTTFPRIKPNNLKHILQDLLFSSSQTMQEVPTPQKQINSIKEQIRTTKQAIIEKETFLLNFQQLSKEEVNSRQDYIVGEILKEIYSGLKEFASVRNIGVVVDKNNLLYGKPINVTDEFIKWMKNYHSKYKKQSGGKK
ncbi:MAG: OmpH family outer membrane protein [Elusimicrobiaceae bacterium]|nr:OmpH family outer membrane protein [Elusimicrobiaceae bacterium]